MMSVVWREGRSSAFLKKERQVLAPDGKLMGSKHTATSSLMDSLKAKTKHLLISVSQDKALKYQALVSGGERGIARCDQDKKIHHEVSALASQLEQGAALKYSRNSALHQEMLSSSARATMSPYELASGLSFNSMEGTGTYVAEAVPSSRCLQQVR